jgi:hypothetical protein
MRVGDMRVGDMRVGDMRVCDMLSGRAPRERQYGVERVGHLPAKRDVAAFDLGERTVQRTQDHGIIRTARMQAGVAQQFQQGLLVPETGFHRRDDGREVMDEGVVRLGAEGRDAGAQVAAAAAQRDERGDSWRGETHD